MTMGPYYYPTHNDLLSYYPTPLSQKRESSPSAVFKDLVLSKTPKERKRKIERMKREYLPFLAEYIQYPLSSVQEWLQIISMISFLIKHSQGGQPFSVAGLRTNKKKCFLCETMEIFY